MFEKLCFFILAICAVKGVPPNMPRYSQSSRRMESCYADNDNPYPYTGVKTPYDFVHSNITKRVALRGEYSCRKRLGEFRYSGVINRKYVFQPANRDRSGCWSDTALDTRMRKESTGCWIWRIFEIPLSAITKITDVSERENLFPQFWNPFINLFLL